MTPHLTDFTPEELERLGIFIVGSVLNQVLEEVKDAPDVALVHITKEGKETIFADQEAHSWCLRELRETQDKRFAGILPVSEEGMKSGAEVLNQNRVCALFDPIDGSDLIERGLGNWCSAAVFFHPKLKKGERLKAAIVGVPNGDIYHARHGVDGARVERFVEKHDGANIRKEYVPESVRGHSKVTSVERASVCFYGQKVGNLMTTAALPLWQKLNEKDQARKKLEKQRLPLRVYNLAGIPMMTRMVDKTGQKGSGIDVVFDSVGQYPHDVVAGAYIALKAGASLLDFEGKRIDVVQLEEALLNPDSPTMKYVLASTERLARNFLKFMKL